MKTEGRSSQFDFLNRVTATYQHDSPYLFLKRQVAVARLASLKDAQHTRCLALGCADGFEASLLCDLFEEVHVVDGSTIFIDQCKSLNLKNTTFHHGLFEEIDSILSDRTFDCVVASLVVEHIADPNLVLRKVKRLIADGGFLFAVVPNAFALSRQLAVKLGLLSEVHELTENDLNHGHRRVYDVNSFRQEFIAAGYTIKHSGGLILKPLADFQMDMMLKSKIIEPQHVWKLDELASEYAFLSDCLYIAAA